MFLCGDLQMPGPSQVVLAAADGSAAAIDIHRALVAHTIGTGHAKPAHRVFLVSR